MSETFTLKDANNNDLLFRITKLEGGYIRVSFPEGKLVDGISTSLREGLGKNVGREGVILDTGPRNEKAILLTEDLLESLKKFLEEFVGRNVVMEYHKLRWTSHDKDGGRGMF